MRQWPRKTANALLSDETWSCVRLRIVRIFFRNFSDDIRPWPDPCSARVVFFNEGSSEALDDSGRDDSVLHSPTLSHQTTQMPPRANTISHVCWHRSSTIGIADYHVALQVGSAGILMWPWPYFLNLLFSQYYWFALRVECVYLERISCLYVNV